MRKIKTWKLFENNSIDYIEGELEDIVIHYCEGTNADFKSELGYEFYPLSDYLLFTKFDNLEKTIIEILDWISTNLEMKVGVYLNKIIYNISSGIVFTERWMRIIRSWLEERDPLFKEFNISIVRNDSSPM